MGANLMNLGQKGISVGDYRAFHNIAAKLRNINTDTSLDIMEDSTGLNIRKNDQRFRTLSMTVWPQKTASSIYESEDKVEFYGPSSSIDDMYELYPDATRPTDIKIDNNGRYLVLFTANTGFGLTFPFNTPENPNEEAILDSLVTVTLKNGDGTKTFGAGQCELYNPGQHWIQFDADWNGSLTTYNLYPGHKQGNFPMAYGNIVVQAIVDTEDLALADPNTTGRIYFELTTEDFGNVTLKAGGPAGQDFGVHFGGYSSLIIMGPL